MAKQVVDVVEIHSGGVSAADVIAVARGGAPVVISDESLAAIRKSRAVIDALANAENPAYGVSTGFGALAQRHIPVELRVQLQRSLIRSHAAGMGPAVEAEVVRALMFLRLKTLCSGHTGVRVEVVNALAEMLNANITPTVREFGSLGCSGDLAPLSHIALALMGEGECGPELAAAGIEPVELKEKEGLALINGTDGMLGMLMMALADLEMLVATADLTAAMSIEGLMGTDQVFRAELQALRPHPGQAASAANLMRFLHESPIIASHRVGDSRVQDAYSLRCTPQVHGAVRDTLTHAMMVGERELRAAVDNPVVLDDGTVCSNGNFHGAPVGYVLDFCAIAVADLASMSERRTDRHLDKARNHGLPPFLADDPGVDSGLMIAQYTQAALVHECKRLAMPSSVDSIPSSAMQEDHVSMGWSAARKLRLAVDNLARVLAIEAVTAARSIELRAPLEPAAPTGRAIAALRSAGVGGVGPDRYLSPELEAAYELVRSGALLRAATQSSAETKTSN
jgi:histidine ammonia-lyase